jgi:hypothetical protein
VVDTVIGVLAANWQTNIGRLAIIAGCLLVIILIAGATARGRSN